MLGLNRFLHYIDLRPCPSLQTSVWNEKCTLHMCINIRGKYVEEYTFCFRPWSFRYVAIHIVYFAHFDLYEMLIENDCLACFLTDFSLSICKYSSIVKKFTYVNMCHSSMFPIENHICNYTFSTGSFKRNHDTLW